ncbi:MAG TPA: nuclear transport factor 2 family protein [Hyphomonadaceae bacterium]|jgi:ketosteroid isomerase-like protein|nr:nuclear transport factor 2 family protein [Hyphomonadaceae bacterium]
MPLSANAQLIARLFNEVAKGNGQVFWEHVHDDAVWRTIGTGSWSGTFKGKDSIINDIFRPLGRKLVSRQTDVTRIIDGGEVIVVQAKGKNLTHGGIAYDNDYCFVITMREGKIATYEEYCDTELIANVLGDRLSTWRPAEKKA